LQIRKAGQRDQKPTQHVFPTPPRWSLILVEVAKGAVSQPLYLAVRLRRRRFDTSPSGSKNGTPSGTGRDRIEPRSTLATKLVPGRISVLAGGTTDVLVFRGPDFRGPDFRRPGRRFVAGSFGDKNVGSFALDLPQKLVDCLLPFSGRIAEIH